jgi:isopenicillin N synthase-like dioxygenase
MPFQYTLILSHFIMQMEIPAISFGCVDFDERIQSAAREYGFFVLQDHNINMTNIDELFCSSQKYFSQPLDMKMGNHAVDGGSGYVPANQERLDSQYADPKESLNIRYNSLRTHHPCIDARLTTEIWQECYLLSNRILQSLALGMDKPANWFSKSHCSTSESGSTLRLLHYFPTSPGKVRAGCHSDYGSVTLLFQQGQGGLQVFNPNEYFWMCH